MRKKILKFVFLAANLLPGYAQATCDVSRMFSVLRALPSPTTKLEIDQLKRESTDGGVWTIGLDEKHIPIFLFLTLNGESGYVEKKYIRFKEADLLISNTAHMLATNSEFTFHSAHCEDRVVMTVMKNSEAVRIAPDLMKADSALEMSEGDRKRLYDSPEIAAYVERMKEW